MKILIDTHLSDQTITGIGRYINELLTALLKIDTKNEYHILTHRCVDEDHPIGKLEAPNLMKTRVHFHGPSPMQHLRMHSIMKKISPDIYHHPHFDLPMGHRIPSIITIHDLKYIRHPEYFPGRSRMKTFYMKKMVHNALQRTDKVVADSESTKRDLTALFPVQEDKIVVIHLGLAPFSQREKDSNFDDSILKKYGIKKKFILFVGERRPHKNIGSLIKAFKILRDSNKVKMRLVIVGKSYSNYREPEEIVDQEGLNEDVIFTDHLRDNELPTFYQNAAMLVLPSLYEGFGFPILEAMGCGIPVLGSNRTSIPEVMGDAGLLFKPHDVRDLALKMEKVLSDATLRRKMISRGLERAKQFRWENVALQTLNVYQDVYQRKLGM